ncbi:hypothetical protein EIN43_26975 (plasmid) [Enterobacter hormaechei]|uniref:Uncharacterized protein n=1 Tax=Enterobacter hormaechei TaxID=158836 RepID=A0A4Y5ZQ19_9ENTR|nr:hypothetical protein EIN43_26975 [Enterobacter hormaechei]
MLDEDGPNKPSEMEMTFISDGVKYRYGLSIFRENKRRMVVLHTKSRETILFERDGLSIEVNKAAFSESNLLSKKGLFKKQGRMFHLFRLLLVLMVSIQNE